MAYNLRPDDMPQQSVELLRLLRHATVHDSEPKETPDATDGPSGSQSENPEVAATDDSSGSQSEIPELGVATPRLRVSVLARQTGMDGSNNDQSVDVFPSRALIADGSMSTPNSTFVSGPQNNAFDHEQNDGDTYDRPGQVSLPKPRMSRFVAKLARIQAAERAAQESQGAFSSQSSKTSGPADNLAHDPGLERAQIERPVTPRNPLHATPINPTLAVSRVARSSSQLSHINRYRRPSVQGNTGTRSTYLDHISPLRFPNLEQSSPLEHRNRPRFNPNRLSRTNMLFAGNAQAAMPPRHAPSAGQLSGGRVTTGVQGVQPSNVSSIRRMTSTPSLTAPQASPSASGNGPVHVPTHPRAMSHTLTNQAIGGGNVPTHAKTAEYLRRIKRMVLHAVQINRYKNGLFVTSITPRSELLNDMNVFINSAQVTGLDNLRIVNIKEGIERIYSAIRQGNEVKSIYGREMWAVDIEASWMLSELTDVLNSTDKHEHARWLEIYGNP